MPSRRMSRGAQCCSHCCNWWSHRAGFFLVMTVVAIVDLATMQSLPADM